MARAPAPRATGRARTSEALATGAFLAATEAFCSACVPHGLGGLLSRMGGASDAAPPAHDWRAGRSVVCPSAPRIEHYPCFLSAAEVDHLLRLAMMHVHVQPGRG